MTIKTINRATCGKIRTDLNAALETIGKELGLTIHAGSASYSDTSVTFKVECVLEGVDKGKENFERDCFLFDLPESAYKAEFTWNQSTWILEGLKTRSPKFPIIASKKGTSGPNYKLPEKAVKSLSEKKVQKVTVIDFDPKTTGNLRGKGDVGV